MLSIKITTLPFKAGSEYFQQVRHLPYPVLLDSGQPKSPSGRYDIVAADPVQLINSQQLADSSALDYLQQQLNKLCPESLPETELPFTGGFIGGLSYDLGRELEKLPEQAQDDTHFPDLIGGIYLWAIVVDHQQQTAYLVAPEQQQNELEQLVQATPDTKTQANGFKLSKPFTPNLSREEYCQRFEQIIDYIRAGDCYQINFTQRFSAEITGDSWQAYLQMRQATPAPFSAYLDFGDYKVLSVSPERFLKLDQDQVETKPIKGTAPRHSAPEQDNAIAEELQASIKNRAENLMIVDLLRNDLSRACQPGSVKVPHLFALESYANVHHLVSTVTGQLDSDKNVIDLLKASFPGGSITGAPKIRAMEIIDELEPSRRGIYCGSVAYIDFRGQMDSSITIRTIQESPTTTTDSAVSTGHKQQAKDASEAKYQKVRRLDCSAGGGIVYDSEAISEYEETLHKVGKIISSLQPDFLEQFKLD